MRIVLVVHTFFPNWTAGTEVYTYGLAKKAIQKGHQVRIVCYEPPGKDAYFSGVRAIDTCHDGIPVHQISFHREYAHFHLKEYFHKDVGDHLVSYLSEVRPDILHVVHPMHLSTASIWAGKKLGLPVVCTATDFWYICPTYQLLKWDQSLCDGPHPLTCLACVTSGRSGELIRAVAGRKWLARLLNPALVRLGRLAILRSEWLGNLVWLAERPRWMKATLAQVDVFLAPTANTRRLMQANGLNARDLRLSGYGLETEGFDAAPVRREEPVLRLAYIGTFRHSKGVHVLLEAMRYLAPDKVRLDLYGKLGQFPEYDQGLMKLSEGLPNVAFKGIFPNDELPRVFSGFDVLVIPALWYENSPLVLLSAFALKTPVIASQVGSLADLIEHGKSGLLFEMGSARDLAAQVRKLLEDPGMLGRLRAGIPAVKSADQNADELLGIYEELLRNKTGSLVRTSPPSSPVPRASVTSGTLIKCVRMLASGAQFGTDLTLLQCKAKLMNRRELCLDFEWHASEVRADWVVFVHFLDEDGQTRIQGDHPLGHQNQDPWGFLAYQIKLWIAESHLGRTYRVRLGVWIPSEGIRLPVTRGRGFQIDLQERAVCLGAMRMAA